MATRLKNVLAASATCEAMSRSIEGGRDTGDIETVSGSLRIQKAADGHLCRYDV
jgi:hypothetical protein